MERFKFRPIKIIILYSLFTIFLFEFGVMDFRYGDKVLLYLFLLCVHIFICLGFYCGIYSKKTAAYYGGFDGRKLLLDVYKYAFLIYLLTFLPSFFIETRTYSLNINDLIQKIQIGLTDSTILYNGVREAAKVSGIWRMINLPIVLTGFVRWTFYPLSIYLWEYLKTYHKVFFFIFAFFFLASYVTTGTSAGIFTLAFIIGVPILMKRYRKQYIWSFNNELKKNKKRRITTALLVGLIVFACLWLFSNNMKSREASLYAGNGDFTAFPWFIIPESVRPAIYWLTGYVAQGYEALSFCLELPFTPTFGIGNSWFTIQNFSSLFGIPILDYTYLGKAEALGFGAYQNWHTVYTWIANDVSFFGVPFVLFFLFYLMAQSWSDYLDHNDGLAFIFMTIMGFFALYISANNTVFSHADTLFAFYIILYMWKHFRRKYYYDFI